MSFEPKNEKNEMPLVRYMLLNNAAIQRGDQVDLQSSELNVDINQKFVMTRIKSTFFFGENQGKLWNLD